MQHREKIILQKICTEIDLAIDLNILKLLGEMRRDLEM